MQRVKSLDRNYGISKKERIWKTFLRVVSSRPSKLDPPNTVLADSTPNFSVVEHGTKERKKEILRIKNIPEKGEEEEERTRNGPSLPSPLPCVGHALRHARRYLADKIEPPRVDAVRAKEATRGADMLREGEGGGGGAPGNTVARSATRR